MASKFLSIKSATDPQLRALLARVRREYEALRMLRELKIKSTPNPNGQYPAYSTSEAFSTETPVSNGKSIKDMNDIELNSFISRLQDENELARIIMDIQEMNNPVQVGEGQYPDGKMYEGLDLDRPVSDLYHYGIPGMKWYVTTRSKNQIIRDREEFKTKATIANEGSKLLGYRRQKKEDEYSNEKRREAKELSNEELKTIINRLNMEQQYRNLTTKDVNVGKSRTEAYLERAGTIMTIAGAAAGLALTIKTLMPESVKEKVADKVTGG